ncbi:hypothetical protein V6N13_062892 [Hibiscus sabdariffa]
MIILMFTLLMEMEQLEILMVVNMKRGCLKSHQVNGATKIDYGRRQRIIFSVVRIPTGEDGAMEVFTRIRSSITKGIIRDNLCQGRWSIKFKRSIHG